MQYKTHRLHNWLEVTLPTLRYCMHYGKRVVMAWHTGLPLDAIPKCACSKHQKSNAAS